MGLIVTAVMLALGLWQMDRFREQGRDALIERMQQPAVAMSDVVQLGQVPQDAYGRPVSVRGHYLADHQFLVPVQNRPGTFRILTGLQREDGSVVPIVRGVSGAQPPVVPQGEVEQTGIFLPSEGDGAQRSTGPGELGSVRLPDLAQRWTETLTPGFLNLDAAGAQAQGMQAAEIALPSNSGQARNSGYALQWWVFAAAAVATTIKFSRDAARGTGVMRPKDSPTGAEDAVDEPVDNSDQPLRAGEGDSSHAAVDSTSP